MPGNLTNPRRHPCTARSAQSLPMLCQEIEMRSYPPYLIIHPSTHRQWHTQHLVHDHSVVSSITAPCFGCAQLHTYSVPYLSFLHWLESHTDRQSGRRLTLVQHVVIYRPAKQQNKQTKKKQIERMNNQACFQTGWAEEGTLVQLKSKIYSDTREATTWVITLQECEDYLVCIGKHI